MKSFIALVILAIVLILLAAHTYKKNVPAPIPSPTTHFSNGKDEKYRKIMSEPCYNEDGIEIECKG